MSVPSRSTVRHRSPLSVNPGTGELVVREKPELPIQVVMPGIGIGALMWLGLAWFLFWRR